MQRNGKIPLTEGKKRKGAGIGWEKNEGKNQQNLFLSLQEAESWGSSGRYMRNSVSALLMESTPSPTL